MDKSDKHMVEQELLKIKNIMFHIKIAKVS